MIDEAAELTSKIEDCLFGIICQRDKALSLGASIALKIDGHCIRPCT